MKNFSEPSRFLLDNWACHVATTDCRGLMRCTREAMARNLA